MIRDIGEETFSTYSQTYLWLGLGRYLIVFEPLTFILD